MKVSLITASFNSASSIEECIISVNNQTYKNIEHLFIDGGSVDSTTSRINDLSIRDKDVISEKDEGIYDALNKGISMATGDIIGVVHSDDILASNTIINDIVEAFKESKADGIYGDLDYVKKDNLNFIIRKWKGKEFDKNLLNMGWMPAHPTLFLKKKVYDTHGAFDPSYKIAADYNFVLKILKDKNLKFKYYPKVISKMRVGGASNRSLLNIILKSREDLRALKSNEIKNPLMVLFKKNTSKISQFFPTRRTD